MTIHHGHTSVLHNIPEEVAGTDRRRPLLVAGVQGEGLSHTDLDTF